MTSAEILRAIVNADAEAAYVREGALALIEDFDKYVNNNIENLRARIFAETEAAITRTGELERHRADKEIAALDKKLQKDIDLAKKRFEETKDEVVVRIFRTAVGLDA